MKIIGAETVYYGANHPYMYGYRVLIRRVMRGHGDDVIIFTADNQIEEAGGIQPSDWADVNPFIRVENRFSWVSSDVDTMDLEMFGAKPKQELPETKGQ